MKKRIMVIKNKKIGPEFKTKQGKKLFFDFYKTHRSRALLGFLKDIGSNKHNKKILSKFLQRKRAINCLVLGCSHWANPKDTATFLKSFNKKLKINMVALDVLPDALLEAMKHDVECTPIVCPAQDTPFLNNYFDIVVCDCLLTCCSFDQHGPVIHEISRILKKGGLLLLGVVYSKDKNVTFVMPERPIMNYCRPINDYKKLFNKNRLNFLNNHSVTTHLPGKWSDMSIENTVLSRR